LRLVVAGDRGVEQGLEDPELRREEAIHGRSRHVGAGADRLDGRRHVAALDEQLACGLDHGAAGQSGAGLAPPTLVGYIALDGFDHETIVSLSI
jgi:hypothetical protein